jgi:hypothetical protein
VRGERDERVTDGLALAPDVDQGERQEAAHRVVEVVRAGL